MNKTLIVFYSKTGNVKLLALKASQLLEADVEALVDQTKWTGFDGFIRRAHRAVIKGETKLGAMQYDPNNYEKVLIFSPLWGPTICPAIRTYLNQYIPTDKEISLVVLGAFSDGSGAKEEAEKMGYKLGGFLALLDKGQTGKENGELQGENSVKLKEFIEGLFGEQIKNNGCE